MKKITFCNLVLTVASLSTTALFSQQSYTFTNAGATGRFGPSQTQITAAYQNTNLNGLVGSTSNNGIQTFAVQPGVYRIEAFGGQGGTSTLSTGVGGLGARVRGDFTITTASTLNILVGQQGEIIGYNTGGGGGTFVWITGQSLPLIVAGGGGGAGYSTNGVNGATTTAGTAGVGSGGTAGTNGNGANPGGGGWLSDGTNFQGASCTPKCSGNTAGLTTGGASPTTAIGYHGCAGTNQTGDGGFGGGSGGNGNCTTSYGGGGGGGYSGGVGQSGSTSGGGGGGSYNGGLNQSNSAGVNTGHGKVIITELCSITLNLMGANSNSAICAGNSVTITTNAVSNYSWSNGANTSSIVVAPSATTVYSLTATSPSNCTASAAVTVFVNSAVPSLTVVNTSSTTGGVCPTASVTLTASGATTYSWTGASTVINGIPFAPSVASGYTVTGTNACGSSTAATSVSIHPLPTVGATVSQNTVCSTQTIILTGTGNAQTYTWTGGAINGATHTPVASTIYTVTGTSAKGCTATATQPVTVVTTPNLAPVLSTVSICNGGQATITASGATNYTWLPMNTNASSLVVNPTAPQTYTVIKSNANCVDTKTITLHVNQLPIIYAVTNNATVCASTPATLTAGGGLTYTWSPLGGNSYTAVVAPSVTTIYTVAASDGSCVSSSTVEVATNPNPVINIAATSSVICNGETVTLTLSGALSYTWAQQGLSGTQVVVSPSVSSLYQVTGINSHNCTSIQQQIIIVNPLPPTNATMNRTLVCSGFPSTLTASGAHAYSWSSGSQSNVAVVYPVVTTIYTVTGSYTTTGCAKTKTLQVAVFSPTFASTSNTAICAGGSILLTASGANSYTWSGLPPGQPSVMPNVMVSPTVATIYTVTANSSSPQNYVSCLSSNQVSVGIYTNPTITATADRTLICRSEKVDLFGHGGNTYTWSHGLPPGATITVAPLSETKYTVTGTDIYNCVNTGTVLVRVSACPGFAENQISTTGLSIYPNPNNGTFVIKTDVAVILELRNQLGQVVNTFNLDDSNNHQADVKDLANGIYFVTGVHQGQPVTQKILIAK